MFFRKKVKIVAQPTVNTLFVQTGNGDAVPVTMEKCMTRELFSTAIM